MTDYLSECSTVTGAYCAAELRKLLEALKSKRRGKLRRGVLLLHDNAPAHTSAAVTSAAAECSYELLCGGATGKAFGLAISRSWVQILLEATLHNNLRQVVYTYVPLSPSSITWYRPNGSDALRLGR